jgi:NADPH-dependent curcumin reductase CurA
MAPVKNGRLVFNEIPTGYPIPGQTTIYDESETIDLENAPLKGGFLVKTLVLSIDPYLRGKMRHSSVTSYSDPFVLGESLYGYGLGVVLRSENSAVKAGEHVYGTIPFEKYFFKEDFEGLRVIENKEKIPWSLYVGLAGMAGQTSYYGWKAFSDAKKGETVFVSGAAGPVGSFVIQLAKAQGLKVIGSAGSEEKVAFVKSVGADVAFNYKTTDTAKVLEKEGPIDIYWDNVGGSTLDAALVNSARDGRIIVCGQIANYNGQTTPIHHFGDVLKKQLRIYGLLVRRHAAKYATEFYDVVPKRLASGEIKYVEDLTHGLENAGQAILDVQTGKNTGKSVVIVAQE